MSTTGNKKQKSILDFFKSNKPPKQPLNTVGNDVIDQLPKTIPTSFQWAKENNDITNLENNIDAISIDVNFVDESFVDFTFEEEEEIKCTKEKEEQEQELTSNNENSNVSSNYIFHTFRNILKNILTDSHYEHLFNEKDWNDIQDFTSLTGPVQILFIKLYMRKHDWINVKKINYPELSENGKTKKNFESNFKELKILKEHKFLLDTKSFQSIEEAFSSMTLPDIKYFMKKYGYKLPKNATRTILISDFINYIRTVKSVNKNINVESKILSDFKNAFLNKCVKINEDKSKLFDRIFLLYYNPNRLLESIESGNGDQWYRNILGDFGVSDEQYPVLTTNKTAQIYSTHEELLEFCDGFSLLCEVIALINNKQYKKIVEQYIERIKQNFIQLVLKWIEKDKELDEYLRQFTAAGIYARLLNQCLIALEKTKNYEQYIELVELLLDQSVYGWSYRSHWLNRAALISHLYLKDIQRTEMFCNVGLFQDSSVKFDNSIELYTRLTKIHENIHEQNESYKCFETERQMINKYKKEIAYGQYRRFKSDCMESKNYFVQFLPDGEMEIPVEQVAIRFYLDDPLKHKYNFSNGIHCESSVYHALFVLLFWDIIYSINIPDSFRYQKQLVPLDLKYECFYYKRKSIIDERLVEIEKFTEEELKNELTRQWNIHQNKQSIFINWNNPPLEQLIEIAICFTSPKLAKILDLLVKNYRHFKKGFPDLIMWNFETRKIKVVEVKGPGDRLSNIQSYWLSYLNKFDIDAVLCQVKPWPNRT